ncbi:hypothetical protein niasHT_024667 [Heterodera trifolii]|uniref:NADH dehydrogenase [ubiquinone] 1 alpha subcomplex subunit 13 n=1 Tax=Heterodera trifolii TaxID=157864 RepID=A0ABD2K7N9_9BILA
MPPQGGYPTFHFHRTFPKSFFTPGRIMLFGVVLPTFYGYFKNCIHDQATTKNDCFEEQDLINALEPFMMAERDRSVLRIMKRNRELENEVMKDVPGWKTGTWYGEPVYFTLGNKWIEPISMEVNAHLSFNDSPFNHYYRLLTLRPQRKV